MLDSIVSWISRAFRGDRGQDLIEYALLAGLIALAFVGIGLLVLSDQIASLFDGIAACIDFNSGTECAV